MKLIIALFIFVCVVLVIMSNIKIKIEQEKNQNIFKKEEEIIVNIVKPVANKYNIDNYKYEHLEVTSIYGVVYLKMNDFQNLSNEDKLLFLSDLALSVYDREDLFPAESKAFEMPMDFKIVTDEHTYNDFCSSKLSWLMEDGNKIFEMETEYAIKVNQSLYSMLNPSGSSYNGYSYEERKEQCSKTWGKSWREEINRRYNCSGL